MNRNTRLEKHMGNDSRQKGYIYLEEGKQAVSEDDEGNERVYTPPTTAGGDIGSWMW